MRTITIVLNEKRQVRLTCYLQEVDGEFRNIVRRPAVIVLPGGGYMMCSKREMDPVAMAYLKAGYQVFVLEYSVKQNAVWPNPLEDYEQAMELIQEKAEEWAVYEDKIAVIGFSAGGHLAAAAATIAQNRPAAVILGYAVTTNEIQGLLESAPSLVEEIDAMTPPCFLFATRTDQVVLVHNTVDFMEGLIAKGISFESHIYSYGPHGFSTCDSSVESPDMEISARVPNWVNDSVGWLREVLGDFGNGVMTEPKIGQHISADWDEYLSVDATVGCVRKNPEGAALLRHLLEQGNEALDEKRRLTNMDTMSSEQGLAFGKNFTIRHILNYAKVPEKAVEALDAELRKIRNNK